MALTNFAFVFPGQGSQSVGMLAPYAELPAVRATLEEAGEVLDVDLWGLIAEGPAEELNKTVNTQPAMLAAGIALSRAWREVGGAEPAILAGHSLGEYTALVAGGALEFRDALPLVRFRAQAMQEAVPEGAGGIAAILGLDAAGIQAVCAEAGGGEVLEAANFNAPDQIVIAGTRAAVERGMALAKARGAKRVLLLPMSVPSHCSLMHGAAQRLKQRLEATPVHGLRVDVLNNVDVAAPRDPSAIRDALVRQLHRPVRWVDCIREIERRGIAQIVECGPGGVLAGLNKRITRNIAAIAIGDAQGLAQLAGSA